MFGKLYTHYCESSKSLQGDRGRDIIALPLYEVSKHLIAYALQESCINSASFCSHSRGNQWKLC